MSTKTSFKRIALVAVASLGLGVLTSVSANAAALEVTSTVVATAPTVATTLATPAAQGSTITATINFVQAAVSTTAAHTITSTYVITDPNGTVVTADATFTSVATAVGGVTTTNSGAVYTHSLAIGSTAATKAVGTVTFPAKTAGRYVITYSTVNTTIATDTNTAITGGTAGSVYVSGSGAVVASSGIGTTTIGAVSGGIAKVRFGTDAHTSSTVYNLTSSGVGTIQAVEAGALDVNARVGISAASDFTQGAKITTDADTTFNDVIATVASNVAGTQTLTWTKIDATTGNPTVVATQAITWGAAPALAATNSTAYIQAGVGANSATSDATVSASKTAGDAANIAVTLKDNNGNALNGQKLTVTIDGPGLIGVDVNSVDGVTATRTNRIYADSSANAGNVWQIGVASDGTAGTSRITISVGTTVIAVKSLTFYGSVAKLTASSVLIATANGTGTSDAVVVCAADSAGNAVPGATIYATSGDTSVASVSGSATTVSTAVLEVLSVASATAINPTNYVAAKAIGCAGFTVTGASQTVKDAVTLTFRDAAVAADATASTTLSQNVGGVKAAAVTVAFDKASYAAGSKATVSLTFKDATGRLVGAGPGTATLTAALVSSASLQGAALFAAANNVYKGVATADVYVPWNAGTITITGTTGAAGTYLETAGAGAAITASAKVTAAADSTSAQIASLISKINALAKLIAKIQKKLGVK